LELTAPTAGGRLGRGLPSAPIVGSRQLEALLQRVIAGQESVCERDLPPPVDAELLPQDIAMGLRCARGDAQGLPELVVRQALGDQLDHLSLTRGDRVGIS
jgi:hypothetical protein